MKRRPKEFSGSDLENIMDLVNMSTTEGSSWRKHRRISSRPLTEANLDKLVPMMAKTAQKRVGSLQESADKDGHVVWRPTKDLRLCAARIATAVYMGEENPTPSKGLLFTTEMQEEIWSLVSEAFMITLYPTCVLYHDRFLYKLIFPGVRKFAQRLKRIQAKLAVDIRRQVEAGFDRHHLHKSLMESAGTAYSETELVDTLLLYIAGGSETTASAMSWLLSSFCLHPEIQQRARREADSIGELSVDSIHSMPFIEACALESVR
ncbi:hypothetical protein FOZ62_031334, partial [Perkinsus olseni]